MSLHNFIDNKPFLKKAACVLGLGFSLFGDQEKAVTGECAWQAHPKAINAHDPGLIAHIKQSEGYSATAYLDSGGEVKTPTIGVGHAVFSEQDWLALPWRKLDKDKHVTCRMASRKEKLCEYKTLLSQADDPDYTAAYYRKKATIGLDGKDVDALLAKDLSASIDKLRDSFDEFDTWPPYAQYAAIDMKFNLNGHLNPTEWPGWHAAMRRRDFQEAKEQCRRIGVGQRNANTEDLFAKAHDQQAKCGCPSGVFIALR